VEHDIRKIAETQGVGYVLEGSVRRAGNRIRVAAQFVTWLAFSQDVFEAEEVTHEVPGEVGCGGMLQLRHSGALMPANLAASREKNKEHGFSPAADCC
jgi:hypothetical protein